MNLVSVIVVNHNGKHHLKECLNSLKSQTYKKIETIFVDNNSTDGSVEYVKEKFPWCKVIALKTNCYSNANNVGIRKSKGNYIITLANDTKANKTWIEELMKVASNSPKKVGMFATKQLRYYEPEKINSVGTEIFRNGMSRGIARGEESSKHTELKKVFGAEGVSAMYKRELLEDVGLLDEDISIYDEDFDLQWRARLRGWECLLVPKAIIWHKVAATVKRGSDFMMYHKYRNWLWVNVKNLSVQLFLKNFIFILFSELRFIAWLIVKKRIHLFKARIDSIKKLPIFFRKRRIIQERRTVSSREIEKWMKAFPM